MPKDKAAITRRILIVGQLAMLGLASISATGCHSSDEPTTPTPSAQSQAQSRMDSAAAVQNNPNIPPEAKAHITAQVQGTAPPPITPAAHP